MATFLWKCVVSVVFLIGGTGNQLFQYAASAPTDKFSCFFLQAPVRQILKWSDHEQVITFPTAPWYSQGLSLIVLFLDLMLARLFHISLFTTLDLQHCKIAPRLGELCRYGYFQNSPERRDLSEIAAQISPEIQKNRIAVHVRGGDLLQIEKAGQNIYGMLGRDYFLDSLNQAKSALLEEHTGNFNLVIVTDDPDYAGTLKLGLPETGPVEIMNLSLGDTLAIALGADWFVASNSTLSYWIVRLRSGHRSIAPRPFQKRRDYILPDKTTRISVDFDNSP